MNIRFAEEKDSKNLAVLSIQVWLHAYAREGIRTEISDYVMNTFTEKYVKNFILDDQYRVLVCVDGPNYLGYLVADLESFFESPSNGYEILTLYVQDHFKGKGIGKALLRRIGQLEGPDFWLSTWIGNVEAQAFYNHLGFQDIGMRYFLLGDEQHENRIFVHKNQTGGLGMPF